MAGPCEAGMSPKACRSEVTVAEMLDMRIQRARREVERLCVLKAKAEALNILGHEAEFYFELGDCPY